MECRNLEEQVRKGTCLKVVKKYIKRSSFKFAKTEEIVQCAILTSRRPPLGSSFERLLSFYEDIKVKALSSLEKAPFAFDGP